MIYVGLYRFWLDSSLLGARVYTRYKGTCNSGSVTYPGSRVEPRQGLGLP